MLKNFEYPAQRDILPNMLKDFSDYVSNYVKDDKMMNRLKICAEEILVNIVDYSTSKKIYMNLDYLDDKQALKFDFIDEGIPYNPLEEKPEVDIEAEIDERNVGGLGIFLYTTIMDKLEYKFEDGKNHLTTIKYLDKRKGD